MKKNATVATTVAALTVLCTVHAHAVPVVTAASGATPAAIQSAVDSFRGSLGTLNPNTAGSVGSGRREINWDGVPNTFAAPNNLPADFFNVNSPRGVVFSTPGSGFQVSATAASGTPVEFGNLNPALPGQLASFSAERLFTSLGSNITDVNFFVPGSTTVAGVRGFGAVFSDVDLANVSSMQFFGVGGASLGAFFVPSATGDQTLSFLGVDFGTDLVTRVRITSGNTVLTSSGGVGDLVAMDDFIYGEPVVISAVPEPSTYALTALGLAAVAWRKRRRREN